MRTLMLDVVSGEGRDVFLKLIEGVDIFIEASRGGQWDKWGYSDELLWERNRSSSSATCPATVRRAIRPT